MDLSWSCSVRGESPIFGAKYKAEPFSETCGYHMKVRVYLLMIPDDGCQTQDLIGDRGYADIRITKRRSPKSGHTPTSRIMNQFHCPSKLRDNILVGKHCHMWMCPGMYSNVILIRIECTEKRLRIVDDIDANEEMCRL